MNKTVKWGSIAVMLLFFAAMIASCSSPRHLGCPMKITHAAVQTHWLAC